MGHTVCINNYGKTFSIVAFDLVSGGSLFKIHVVIVRYLGGHKLFMINLINSHKYIFF